MEQLHLELVRPPRRSSYLCGLSALTADCSHCEIVVSYWLNFGVSYTHSDVVWRFPIAFQILFALIIFIGMIFLPESPRWYVHSGIQGIQLLFRFENKPNLHCNVGFYPRIVTSKELMLLLHYKANQFMLKKPTQRSVSSLTPWQPAPQAKLASRIFSLMEKRNTSAVCCSVRPRSLCNRLGVAML